jgi:hypothetical protein
MRDKKDVFMLPKRPEIARTVYHLCNNPHKECYTARVFQYVPEPVSKEAVVDAIPVFEEQGWIERIEREGRIKPIKLTEEGERIFPELVDFLEVLER